jgi:hypothetical protein
VDTGAGSNSLLGYLGFRKPTGYNHLSIPVYMGSAATSNFKNPRLLAIRLKKLNVVASWK